LDLTLTLIENWFPCDASSLFTWVTDADSLLKLILDSLQVQAISVSNLMDKTIFEHFPYF
jgi:hypothetical protein